MMDGVEGAGGRPFLAQPDRFGQRHHFAIVWAATDDLSGGVLVRAEGLSAEQFHDSMDNTEVPKLIRKTLFGSGDCPPEIRPRNPL